MEHLGSTPQEEGAQNGANPDGDENGTQRILAHRGADRLKLSLQRAAGSFHRVAQTSPGVRAALVQVLHPLSKKPARRTVFHFRVTSIDIEVVQATTNMITAMRVLAVKMR